MSLIDVTMNIGVSSLPGVLPRLCVVTSMSGDAGDRYKIELVNPEGETLFLLDEDQIVENDWVVEYGSRVDGSRVSSSVTFGEFRPFVVKSVGLHRIVLSEGDRVVHEHVFGVYMVPEEGPQENEA